MASRDWLKHSTGSSSPSDATLGDEWFNTSTNRLLKRVATNGTTVEWREVSGGVGVQQNGTTFASSASILNFANATLQLDGTTGAVRITSTASPGGSNTQVQFNGAGSLAGSANFTWNNATSDLSVIGRVGIGVNPSELLDIQSSSTGNILGRIVNLNNAGTGSASFRIVNQGNNAQGSNLQFSDTNFFTGTISSDRTNGMQFYAGQMGSPLASERLRIDLNGAITGGGYGTFNRLDTRIGTDQPIYWSWQRNIEEGNGTGMVTQGGTAGTVQIDTSTSAPFGKTLLYSNYYESITDEFIPVQPGETLYGEIWAFRANGAAGAAGVLYAGVAQYDSSRNPIATNIALNYFVANAVTVPTTGVWTRYSGTITLPTSHTPFNGSDGGPVRYVRPYLIVNYVSGTIPTRLVGYFIRRQTIFRDGGNVVFPNVFSSNLTSGRVTFATTSGQLTDSASLTWNGTTLGVTGFVSTARVSMTGGVNSSAWSGATGIGFNTTGTFTDTSGAGGTIASRVNYSFNQATMAANVATNITLPINLFVDAPAAGANTTFGGTAYALYAQGNTRVTGIFVADSTIQQLAGFQFLSTSGAVSSAGSVQGDATLLTTTLNNVTTVGASTQGVRLPALATAGARIIVRNGTSTAFNVYPGAGAQINTLGTNAAFGMPATLNATVEFVAVTTTQWSTLAATYA